MSDVQITVWLRRETGLDMVINALCQVLVNLLFNEIPGDYLLFLSFHYGILVCHNCSSVTLLL